MQKASPNKTVATLILVQLRNKSVTDQLQLKRVDQLRKSLASIWQRSCNKIASLLNGIAHTLL